MSWKRGLLLAATTTFVVGCSTGFVGTDPGVDCRRLGPPPITETDAETMSIGLARWFDSAIPYCEWGMD